MSCVCCCSFSSTRDVAVEEYYRNGPPVSCQNAAVVEIVTQLTKWGMYTDTSAQMSKVSSGGSVHSSSGTKPLTAVGGQRLSVSGMMATPDRRPSNGNDGHVVPRPNSRLFGGMGTGNVPPKLSREGSNTGGLFDGNDPIEGLQMIEVCHVGTLLLSARTSCHCCGCAFAIVRSAALKCSVVELGTVWPCATSLQ